MVRALVKEFSQPERNKKPTSQDHFSPPPSKFQSSGFQSFKGQIQFKISKDDKLEPHQIVRKSKSDKEETKARKELTSNEKNLLAISTSSADISQRLSRSMESLDNILKELSDVISKDPKLAPADSPTRLSSSLLDLNTFEETLGNNDIGDSKLSSAYSA